MLDAGQTILQTAASAEAERHPLFPLSRQLAHDFNNIWAHIFGLTQQVQDTHGAQDRDDLLSRLSRLSCCGLMYSRNVMEALAHPPTTVDVMDACAAVREWKAETEAALLDNITFSCLVPPYPLHIRLPANALRLILLSLVGYALRTGEDNRWAMLGVRSSKGERRAKEEADAVDILFLFPLGEGRTSMSQNFQQRIEAIRAAVVPYGGATVTRILPQVGINVRIHLPLAAAPGDEAADRHGK